MGLSDKAIGLVLVVVAVIIFFYYSIWVLILVSDRQLRMIVISKQAITTCF